MLRESTPRDRLKEALTHSRPLAVASFALSYAGMVVLYFMRGNEYGGVVTLLLPLFAGVIHLIGSGLANLFWFPLTSWLGRLNFAQTCGALADPNSNPNAVDRFLDAWWENERTLAAFTVLFSVAFSVGTYRLLGPTLGLL